MADAVGDFCWGGRGRLWHVNGGIDNGIKGYKEASSIEEWVGLAKGDRGEKSGVVDDVPTVGFK